MWWSPIWGGMRYDCFTPEAKCFVVDFLDKGQSFQSESWIHEKIRRHRQTFRHQHSLTSILHPNPQNIFPKALRKATSVPLKSTSPSLVATVESKTCDIVGKHFGCQECTLLESSYAIKYDSDLQFFCISGMSDSAPYCHAFVKLQPPTTTINNQLCFTKIVFRCWW